MKKEPQTDLSNKWLFTKLWQCYFDSFPKISTEFGIFEQNLAIFVEQRQIKRCRSFVTKKNPQREMNSNLNTNY